MGAWHGALPVSATSLLPLIAAHWQVLFECWLGRYPFLQPGQEPSDLDEEDVPPPPHTKKTMAQHPSATTGRSWSASTTKTSAACATS
jgi:hypothetical protein